MAAFGAQLDEVQRWQLVQYVRQLRLRQKAIEKEKLALNENPTDRPF
jgi:mono/diheme cytochrome c family protein